MLVKPIRCPPGEKFKDSLARIIRDAEARRKIAERLGQTTESVAMAIARVPRSGEPSMEERALRKYADAAGYEIQVVFVPKEKS